MDAPTKITLHYRAQSASKAYARFLFLNAGRNPIPLNRSIIQTLVEQANAQAAQRVIEQAERWLEDNGKMDQLINIYDNTDHEQGVGRISITLQDRDAALLLKLAMR